MVDNPDKARAGGVAVSPRRGRPDLPVHLHLRVVVHGAAGGPGSRVSRWCAEPPAGGAVGLRGLQSPGRSGANDRPLAGTLPKLLRCPEIACVFNRAEIPSHLVSGYLQDEEAWKEIGSGSTPRASRPGMRANRVGVLGHYYCGMLDVYSDLTQQSAVFGNHFELARNVPTAGAPRSRYWKSKSWQSWPSSTANSTFRRIAPRPNWCGRRGPPARWTHWSSNTAWVRWPTTTKARTARRYRDIATASSPATRS